jgi:putative transposase
VINVARSGYYAWCRNRMSVRTIENRQLTTTICAIFEKSKETYGSPRVFHSLQKLGCHCGKHRVARLMQAAGLKAVQRRAFRVTTVSRSKDAAPNRLQQNFFVAVPNRIWTTDITYIATLEGWLYLSVILDVHSRRVIGWSMKDRMTDDLVIAAFNAAQAYRRPQPGLIVHSDRGIQFSGQRFRDVLEKHRCIQSMSGTGNCYDNAVTETFFHTLKVELVHRSRFQSRNEARKLIFDYIETFYNRQRLHSTLGYKSPVDFEEQSMTTKLKLVSTFSG